MIDHPITPPPELVQQWVAEYASHRPELPEQAQHVRDLLAPNSRPTPNFSQIGRSLVERVASAIHPDRCADPNLYLHEARAAIREVAAWLIDRRRDDDWLAPFEELAGLLLEEVQQ